MMSDTDLWKQIRQTKQLARVTKPEGAADAT